jgi:uncharacterized protein (TIGR03067 family)
VASSLNVLVIVASCYFCVDAPQDAAKNESELQGIWALVSIERDGKAQDYSNQYPPLVIKGQKVVYGGEEMARLTIDAATKPKCIDLIFHPAKIANEGIYQVEGDSLKICINRETEGLKERPSKFSTMDKPNWSVLVFQRAKKKEDADFKGRTGFVGLMLRFDADKRQVIVVDAFDKSPAKNAGLEKEDAILKVGNVDGTDLVSVVQAIRQLKPGSEVAMKIKRGDKEKDIKVKVGIFPFRFLVQ